MSCTYSFRIPVGDSRPNWMDGLVRCTARGVSAFGCARTDQTFCLIFLPRRTGACRRRNCAGPIRCLSDVDGLFQQQQPVAASVYMRHVFVSPANSVIETPETASIIVARSAPRPKSLSAADCPRRLASVKLLLLPVMRDGTFR